MGTAAIWIPAEHLTHVAFGPHELVDDDGETIGWSTPETYDVLDVYPQPLPGYKLVQRHKPPPHNKRALDDLMHTPFGMRFIYTVEPDTP